MLSHLNAWRINCKYWLCVILYFNQIPNWFHFNCFWRRARVKDNSDIHGFNGLRWDDQQKIKDKLTGSGTYVFAMSAMALFHDNSVKK